MRIATNDLPQANDLDLVVRTVEAVGTGAQTDQDIADTVGEYDDGRHIIVEPPEFLDSLKRLVQTSRS